MKTFPNLTMLDFARYSLIKRIKLIRPLNYIDYHKSDARELLEREFGWEYYGAIIMKVFLPVLPMLIIFLQSSRWTSGLSRSQPLSGLENYLGIYLHVPGKYFFAVHSSLGSPIVTTQK